jgi:hypothetical protein
VKAEWRRVADQLRPKVKKLADLLDEAEEDVLAYVFIAVDHCSGELIGTHASHQASR